MSVFSEHQRPPTDPRQERACSLGRKRQRERSGPSVATGGCMGQMACMIPGVGVTAEPAGGSQNEVVQAWEPPTPTGSTPVRS